MQSADPNASQSTVIIVLRERIELPDRPPLEPGTKLRVDAELGAAMARRRLAEIVEGPGAPLFPPASLDPEDRLEQLVRLGFVPLAPEELRELAADLKTTSALASTRQDTRSRSLDAYRRGLEFRLEIEKAVLAAAVTPAAGPNATAGKTSEDAPSPPSAARRNSGRRKLDGQKRADRVEAAIRSAFLSRVKPWPRSLKSVAKAMQKDESTLRRDLSHPEVREVFVRMGFANLLDRPD